ncbi:MAG: OmpA family protein, partial [Duncaniella dubosii]|nr:OmpA family protein [Duncaniella dubosii]
VPHDVVYLFPLDGSEIPDDATLNDLAKKVAASGAYVSVVAYTDESGNAEYNQRLSERRAKRVGEYLIAHGVPSDHVRTKGMGQTHAYPSAAQDRRAEIHVSV